MGTFEKSYLVDGVVYELYRDTSDGGYQLVDAGGKVVAAELTAVPSDEEVAAIIGEADAA